MWGNITRSQIVPVNTKKMERVSIVEKITLQLTVGAHLDQTGQTGAANKVYTEANVHRSITIGIGKIAIINCRTKFTGDRTDYRYLLRSLKL